MLARIKVNHVFAVRCSSSPFRVSKGKKRLFCDVLSWIPRENNKRQENLEKLIAQDKFQEQTFIPPSV